MIIRRHIEPLDPRRSLPDGLAYVLTTVSKREFHVAHWLEDNGFASLTPLQYRFRATKRHGRGRNVKRSRVEMPLIPRIVIVIFPGPVPWLEVESYRHITGVLGINGTPAPMRPGEVERLRAISDALLAPRVEHPFRPGDRARIIEPDLLAGHVIEIKSLQGRHAKFIQSWFGAEREVEIDLEKLEAA